MTQEEIIKEARKREKEVGFTPTYGLGFLEGAQWCLEQLEKNDLQPAIICPKKK